MWRASGGRQIVTCGNGGLAQTDGNTEDFEMDGGKDGGQGVITRGMRSTEPIPKKSILALNF